MDGKDVVRRRLRSVGLIGPRFASPVDVVRHLGAVQSQDFGPAKWSVGDRLRAGSDAAVHQAVNDGAILRTHVLRPTWHFVLPEDIRWMLELTAPRVRMVLGYYDRQLGIDAKLLRRTHRQIARALAGENHLTRLELKAELGVEADTQRLAHIVMHAELDGLICSGRVRGKQQTYALVEERAPNARVLSRDDALAELTRRYFTSHGPATAKDFHWWSSLTLADIRRGLEAVGEQLASEVVGGLTYWYDPSAATARLPSPTVHLLHGYDEYVVGYTESKHLLNLSGAPLALPRGQVAYNSVVFVDGQVVGHWKRTPHKNGVVVDVVPYAPLPADRQAALRKAADRYGAFVGQPVDLALHG